MRHPAARKNIAAGKLFILLLLLIFILPGCATNPVTGRPELNLISESREIQLGRENYGPSRQIQGGDYNLDPELTRYVKNVGMKLAAVSDRPNLPYDFAVINNSVPNAWALPGGKIAVNRGLLVELKNEAELAAVLGHEIVHAAARHGAKSMERGMLLEGALLATAMAVRNSDYASLAIGGAQIGAVLISQKYSRNAELEADYYGMRYMSRAGYNPQAAVRLQELFLRLSKEGRQNWLNGLFASHPPSRERLEANRETALSLPPGGKLYAKRYQLKIAHLIKTKEAYKAYDEGRKALSKGKIKKALALSQKAIKIEKREALFYGLRGDARLKQRRLKDALKDFNKALSLNDRFFYFYLKRGQTEAKLGDRLAARRDLEKSKSLLPTASAYNSLGNLYLAEGHRQKAVQYFRAAAGSKSQPGRQALRSLVRLDLSDNPGEYLKVRLGLNDRRYVVARIFNSTPLPVHNVEIRIFFRDSLGQLRRVTRSVQGIIEPGRTALVWLGLGPVKNASSLQNIKVSVVRARTVE